MLAGNDSIYQNIYKIIIMFMQMLSICSPAQKIQAMILRGEIKNIAG